MTIKEKDGWTLQEKGWYTNPKLGGVCQEEDGLWHAYPLDRWVLGFGFQSSVPGFKTATEAAAVMEEWIKRRKAPIPCHNLLSGSKMPRRKSP